MTALSEARLDSGLGDGTLVDEFQGDRSNGPALRQTEDPGTVLLVDDDPVAIKILERALNLVGHQVKAYSSAEPLLSELPETNPDAILLDLGLPGLSGFEAFTLIRRYYPTVPIIIHTSDASVDAVVTALQQGAYDYITKPADRHMLLDSIAAAIRKYRVSRRLNQLERDLEGAGYAKCVGQGVAMRQLFADLEQIINNELHVLLMGDSLRAKEHVARAIHEASSRRARNFVPVSASELSPAEIAATLFGRVGPDGARELSGLEAAHEGTLFIDRIEALPPSTQVALSQVLQHRRFLPAGADRAEPCQTCVVAGAEGDLSEAVRLGNFSEELFGHLSTFELSVPQLHPNGEVRNTPSPQDTTEFLLHTEISLDDLERCAIEAALMRTRGNVTRAMRQLGIGRTTLYRKLKRYGLR